MDMIYGEVFSPSYDAERLGGLPGAGEVVQVRAVRKRHQPEGLVVRFIVSDGTNWVGNFEEGDGRISGIYAGPSPFHAYIVANGRGFIVDVRNPIRHRPIRAYPIEHVSVIPALELLIFADLTQVCAYGAGGLAWQTPRVSWDGIEITHTGSDAVRGRGWNAQKEAWADFVADPRTGATEGGAAPPHDSDLGFR